MIPFFKYATSTKVINVHRYLPNIYLVRRFSSASFNEIILCGFVSQFMSMLTFVFLPILSQEKYEGKMNLSCPYKGH